jgi:hypothetical protein
MPEKPQTFPALIYALVFALATAGSAPFWFKPLADAIRPKLRLIQCDNAWLSAVDYRKCFADLGQTHYPAKVQGRLKEGVGEQFSANWESAPAGNFCYMSCYALSDEGLGSARNSLAGQLSLAESMTSFTSTGGTVKHSATWTWSPQGQCSALCP